MDKLAHPTAVDGLFFAGDPQTGQLSTVISTDHMNAVLLELVNLIESSGLTPDRADLTQVAQAVQRLGSGATGLRNRVINPGFRLWQRGTSFAIADSGQYTADRWEASADGDGGAGTATVTRQSFPAGQIEVPGALAFLRYQQTFPASVGTAGIRTKLEELVATSGQSVTVSFDVRVDSAQPISVALIQDFGGSQITVGSQSIDAAVVWQRVELTFAIPSILGQTLSERANLTLEFQTPVSATPILDIANVQLEIGLAATSFEARALALEQMLCRRYFEKSYEFDTPPGTATFLGAGQGRVVTQRQVWDLDQAFAVPKRAAPTVTFYSPSTGSAGQTYSDPTEYPVVGVTNVSKASLGMPEITVNLPVASVVEAHWTADAEL
ncbi:MAG: hypothetical protein AAGB93_00535 [Planctomycetota bacterium]